MRIHLFVHESGREVVDSTARDLARAFIASDVLDHGRLAGAGSRFMDSVRTERTSLDPTVSPVARPTRVRLERGTSRGVRGVARATYARPLAPSVALIAVLALSGGVAAEASGVGVRHLLHAIPLPSVPSMNVNTRLAELPLASHVSEDMDRFPSGDSVRTIRPPGYPDGAGIHVPFDESGRAPGLADVPVAAGTTPVIPDAGRPVMEGGDNGGPADHAPVASQGDDGGEFSARDSDYGEDQGDAHGANRGNGGGPGNAPGGNNGNGDGQGNAPGGNSGNGGGQGIGDGAPGAAFEVVNKSTIDALTVVQGAISDYGNRDAQGNAVGAGVGIHRPGLAREK
jgi:hypothetical protein